MFRWCLKVGGIILVWCFSVLCCDIQSAAFLQKKGSVLEIVFFTCLVSCIITSMLTLLMTRNSWEELKCLFLTIYENPITWRLLLVVAFINVVAVWLMFISFNLSGMAHVYAVKTTEPLVMCLLSLECMQRILRRFFTKGRQVKSPHTEIEEFSSSSKTITVNTWFSVFLVCIGAFLTSGSLKRNMEISLSIYMILFTYFLIFCSNCALALRTTLMKPLLHILSDDNIVFSSSSIYIFMSMIGSSALIGPALIYKGKEILEYDRDKWKLLGIVGLSYGIYQVCNGMVLFYVTPLSYSILKQIRVILIFLFAVYYFEKVFESIIQLILGLILLFLGSYRYATC